MTFTDNFLQRIDALKRLIAESDHIVVGAGAGLSAAAGLDYSGSDFRSEFAEWIERYGISDLYSSSFYPFETEEERWAYWARHIWFARYRPQAMPLYGQLFELIGRKDYFVITTNVDAQFEKSGFSTDRIFATQGDYGLFQPASGYPEITFSNREWVERTLPQISNCSIPSSLIPHTPDGQPVSMNLRCDSTFVEDEHWHRQALRYEQFLTKAQSGNLLLLEFGVGYNTPAIIRLPFEQMALQFPYAALARFNRDYPSPYLDGIRNYITFTEDFKLIFNNLAI